MNEHEAARIASAMHHLRPDWPVKSILTLLMTKLADRPRRDVAVALAWVACESNSATPARVLEQGPWWRAAGVEGDTRTPNRFDPVKCCGICSQPEHICRAHVRPDHEFVPHVRVVQVAVPSDDKRGPQSFTCTSCGVGGFNGAGPICNLCATNQPTEEPA